MRSGSNGATLQILPLLAFAALLVLMPTLSIQNLILRLESCSENAADACSGNAWAERL